MEATAERPDGPQQFKRRVRNYLLDTRFQMGWVLKVAITTAVVVAVMGYFLYDTVADATDQMVAAQMAGEGLTPEAVEAFIHSGEDDKTFTIIWLASFLFGLVLFLSVVTIVLTHKIAGPVFKMKRLLGGIDGEHLQLWEKLRKGDELQDVFEAFDAMVRKLRESRHRDIEVLEQIRTQIADPSTAAAAGQALDELLGRFKDSIRMN